jgi:transposase
MTRASRFSPEVRARPVRMLLEQEAPHDSQWAGITSIAEKIGCTAETLRKCVPQAERDQGTRPGLTTEERQRLKQLERKL